ncbi:VanZ family protein [Clostridium tetani]|uniref:VanZ family protein n=1 Tax=Clostridium tetani TaxID=1513 RepID=UPI00100B92F4|nr:VanZ family protein [Clostridium tetani]RXI46978.1 VanZ family protein [Clostridium tetani]RXM60881.1 VanZ family protein [Clostridium tetani]RXM68612.1 VanZ family protein [Clostridium tetani]
MYAYVFPIKIALLTVIFLIYLAFIPYCIIQYRKHGFVSKYRSFMHIAFVFYIISAFYLVILPLPDRNFVPKHIIHPQLIPFNFIGDFFKEYSNLVARGFSTYSSILKNRGLWQVFFNVLLLTPLGFFLRYFYNINFKKALAISFLTSLFFEVTQLTGIFGIYKYAYRLFDVDDLMLNTIGGVIGYYLVPISKKILPNIDEIDLRYNYDESKVGYIRRGIAFAADLLVINFIPLINRKNDITSIWFILYIILLPYITNGYTLGKKLVKIKIVNESNTKLKFIELIKRYSWLIVISVLRIIFGLNLLSNFHTTVISIINIIYLIIILIIGFKLFRGLFNKNKKMFYEEFSRTHIANSFKLKSNKNDINRDDGNKEHINKH